MNLIFQLYLTNLRAVNTLELIESTSLRVGEYFPLWNQRIHLWLIHPVQALAIACTMSGFSEDLPLVQELLSTNKPQSS